MTKRYPTQLVCLTIAALASATSLAKSAPPKIQTPTPVIYLADNLDEKDSLGWCIDTLGRGYSENLQTHSCKPRGGDVQFRLDTVSGQIRSVAFENKCMEVIAPNDPKIAFGLRDCVGDKTTQKFAFDPQSGRITLAGSEDRCVAAGAQSRQAGPFMSRDLVLAPCATTLPELSTWVVKQ